MSKMENNRNSLTAVKNTDTLTVNELFEQQAAYKPTHIALIHQNTKLSYKQLNTKSNQLAHYLINHCKIKPDDLIVIYLDKSEYTIIAILAILKSGAAYVPIDINYPDTRISYILNDVRSKILLTNLIYQDKLNKIIHDLQYNQQSQSTSSSIENPQQYLPDFNNFNLITIDSEEFYQNNLLTQPTSNPTRTITKISNKNLAYVMYTSGTTGTPKGVMVEHINITSLVTNINYITIHPTDNFLLLSSIAFDASTFEIWAPLLNGSTLVIPPNHMELFTNISLFKNILAEYKVTTLWLTKTLFDHLYLTDITIFKPLANLIIGGEPLEIDFIRQLISSEYAPVKLINGYGPTENTTFSTTFTITITQDNNPANSYLTKNYSTKLSSVPIGKPLDGRIAYVVDTISKHIIPVNSGAIGELWVGGSGLSRGYLNQPELTSQKFIANPFQTKAEKQQNLNNRLYKTGDLARYLTDGNIEYIGRNDTQIKIRGYRVELEEIASILKTYPGIKQAVVIAKGESRNKYLIAYYVIQNIDNSRNHISDNLTNPINNKLHAATLPDTKSDIINNLAGKDTHTDTNLNTYINTNLNTDIDADVELVQDWHKLYNSNYEELDINNFKFNVQGWHSSYTHMPIPAAEMHQWVDETIDKIIALQPQVILEIGCGSGLILFNLLDKYDCKYYYATDFSDTSIEYINKIITKENYQHKVKTLIAQADNITYTSFIDNAYDTVIINSTIQYFPNLDYLDKVIDAVISNMCPSNTYSNSSLNSGQVFIGDVRDYRLLECFWYSILNYQNKHKTKPTVIITPDLISQHSSREEELLVAPEYFSSMPLHNPKISYVELLPKLGDCDNEMNNYRYDVVLHINKPTDKIIYLENSRLISNIKELLSHLNTHIEDYIYLKYPNYRIRNDYLGYKHLLTKSSPEKSATQQSNIPHGAMSTTTLNTISANSSTMLQDNTADIQPVISLHEIKKIIISHGYLVKFMLNINDPLYYDMIIYNPAQKDTVYLNYPRTNITQATPRTSNSKTSQSNNPQLNAQLISENKQFSLKADNISTSNLLYQPIYTNSNYNIQKQACLLKEFLISKLPYYMIPSQFIQLDRLPLTINGKLDIQQLPEPNYRQDKTRYVAPRDEIETKTCNIFAETLGIPFDLIGINDDFFSLGGNSILAIKLVNQLAKQLALTINISAVLKLKNKSVQNLLTMAVDLKSTPIIVPTYTPPDANHNSNSTIPNSYPLSSAQQRLWFFDRSHTHGSNAYNIPLIAKLSTTSNFDILEKALLAIIKRHEVLRTKIGINVTGDSYQQIDDLAKFNANLLAIQKFILMSEQELSELISQNVNYIFDLTNEYPLKITLCKIQPTGENYLIMVIHHIACDGWSIDVLLRDVCAYYNYYFGLSNNDDNNNYNDKIKLELPQLDIQYKDYAVWQKNFLHTKNKIFTQQLDYWLTKLNNYSNLNLPTDKPRPHKISHAGENCYFTLDTKLSQRLRSLAQEFDVSLYSVLLTGFNLLLQIYANQDDIVIGTVVSNRNLQQTQDLIGFFVNTLVLRSKFSPNDLLTDYISQVAAEVIETQTNQDIPFDKLVQELQITADASRHPIFQIMFIVQSFGSQVKQNQPISLTNLDTPLILEVATDIPQYKIARFDLTVFMDDSKEQLTGNFNYATSIFNSDTISQFIKTYTEILRQLSLITPMSQTLIKDLRYLDSDDYQKLINTWNETDKTDETYPSNKTIHQMFEDQVSRNPYNIALIYQDKRLSYNKLNQKANQLAHYLCEKYEIKADELIALCLNRSEHMLITILGVLKSGGAYVPIDPDYPHERISYIIRDTQAKVILADNDYEEMLKKIIHNDNLAIGLEIINSDKHLNKLEKYSTNNLNNTSPHNSENQDHIIKKLHDKQKVSNEQDTQCIRPKLSSKNLAYVIYTSGTTGKPKGVMLEHSGIINRINWMNKNYPLSEKDNILQKTPYVFDVAVWELFWGIWYGATIVFAKPEGHKDAEYLIDIINQTQISIIHFVPSMLSVFANTLAKTNKPNKNLPSLRYMFCSGEELPLYYVKSTYECLPNVELHNLYGPTEASIDVLYFACKKELEAVYIGKPISNTKAYILGNNLTPLPLGAIGELYIGGAGLARGYLNKPELSAEKFIPNPFQTETEKIRNERLYKTGDLARYLPDGNIQYIGRNDFQVKVRGFRIELGEIEQCLTTYTGITQAVVIAKPQPIITATDRDDTYDTHIKGIKEDDYHYNIYLIAYYVAKNELDEEKILNYLANHLPNYMLPNILVHLNQLPLNINGKLERKLLPGVDLSNKPKYTAPKNSIENQLCTVWSEILGIDIDEISTTQSFFKLGGNSILLIKLKNQLEKIDARFIELTIADLFKYYTINKLANYLEQDIRNDGTDNHSTHTINGNFKHIHNHDTTTTLDTLHHPIRPISNNHEIAIIAASGAFSGANSIEELWTLLISQTEGIKRYTLDECRKLGVSESMLQNPQYIPVGGHVDNIDLFDAKFWNISAIEAKQTDPQVRKFLEHCWLALEKSGYIKQRRELNIGVFAGSDENRYFYENILTSQDINDTKNAQSNPNDQKNVQNNQGIPNIDHFALNILNGKQSIATKISYLLELTGPSIAINTACSTGMVSVVEACQKLILGACDLALAGSVSLTMPEQIGYIYQPNLILSQDGHCRVFDKDSTGTIRGSGVGVVVLKRLDEALASKDNILAVIRGYATNNDGGRKIDYTAPSVLGQTECIHTAQKMAGINSDQIDYIECHGTATNLGDPVEIKALHEAFNLNRHSSQQTLYSNPTTHQNNHKLTILGGIKANIGHTDTAAGIAGLIKVCTMLQKRLIPAQANFSQANPELHLESTNFTINTKNLPWHPDQNKPRIAGISSFGIGGTNAHVIIRDYISADVTPYPLQHNSSALYPSPNGGYSQSQQPLQQHLQQQLIFPLSAKSSLSLEKYKQKLIRYLCNIKNNNDNNNTSDGSDDANSQDIIRRIAYTLQHHREHFTHRMVITANSIEQLIFKLSNTTHTTNINNNISKATPPHLIFMFPGQGSQYTNMAWQLYQNDQKFKAIVDHCLNIANQYLPIDLTQVLYTDNQINSINNISRINTVIDINQTEWAQISIFIISYALAKWLNSLGIFATAYIGHSIGEYVAATLSGVFSLNDVIKIVITRGKLMQQMPNGQMLAINAEFNQIELEVIQTKCEIAVINAKNSYVVSGTHHNISQLKALLSAKNISSLILNTSHAYHSSMMEKASTLFTMQLADITLNKPNIPFISNLSGNFITDDEAQKPAYWGLQLRQKVQFAQGIETLCNYYANNAVFIEVGAGRSLSSLVITHTKPKQILTAQLLPTKTETENNLHNKYIAGKIFLTRKEDLGAILWAYGIEEAFTKYNDYNNLEHKVVYDLPGYQFDNKSYWITKTNPISIKHTQLHIKNTQDIFAIKIAEETYTELEYKIAQIFCETLDINEISIYDNLFQLGMNSILGIRITMKIHDILNIEVDLLAIFRYDCLHDLANYLASLQNNDRAETKWEF